MKQKKRLSFKKLALALVCGGAMISASAAQADYYEDDYYDDAYLALVPLIIYSVLSEPRVVVRKRYYREGRLIPRYSRERHHPKKHHRSRSRSRDHYKYPRHGRHHDRF